MKLLPILLLNLATATAAVVVYDQVRPAPPHQTVVGESPHAALADLEARIASLEAERGVKLGGGGVDPRLVDRLNAVERAVDALASAPPPTPKTEARALEATPDPRGVPALGEDPDLEDADPGAADVRRWRRLRDAAKREDHIRRNHARFDKALAKLSFQLTPDQRARVYAAHAAFEPRIGEIWGAIKAQAQETMAAGGTIDGKALRQQGSTQIQMEFTEAISEILPPADAQAVGEVMLGKGR